MTTTTTERHAAARATGRWRSTTWLTRWPGWLGLFLVLLLVSQGVSEYRAYVLCLIVLAAIQAVSMNLSLGLVGLLSFAQLSFFAMGAYGSAVIIDRTGWSFLPTLVIVALGTALVAAAFGLIAIRYTVGLFFALTTFAFSEVVRLVATTWYDVTGGPTGIIVGYQPSAFGFTWMTSQEYLIVFSAVLVLCLGGMAAVLRRPLGQRLLAIREDPYLAEGLGIHVLGHQVGVFAVSAAIAAVAGALSAPFTTVLTPDMMAIGALIPLVGMVVVGGKGTILGPVVGAVIFTLPPIQFSGLGNWNGILLGAVVVLVALFAPRGLLGPWRPEARFDASRMVLRRHRR